MKKGAKVGLGLVGAGVLAALSIPVLNLFVGAPTATAVTRRAEGHSELQPVAKVLERSCANCHSSDTHMPFYAALPVAGSIVKNDIDRGRRYFDLVNGLFPEGDGPATEPAMAKIEWQVDSGAMPPGPYRMLHWEAGLGDGDMAALHSWIRAARLERAAGEGLPEEVAARAVRPLSKTVEVDERRAALGETLYFDKRLSGDDTLSCASCHDLTKGGTDQERVSTGIRGQKGGINAPTTFNAFHNLAQFWDGRAATLQDQAAGPPLNPIEMGGNWEQIISKLSADPALAARFAEAYPDGRGITSETITDAIAEYEKTLITPDSPFDRFLLGDEGALSAEARRGWEVFQSHGCQGCHVGKTLGGQSYELMGRANDYFAERGTPQTDADAGRFSVTKNANDRHHFKVPLLRNVALTFPYFHDGSAEDLTSAVRTMGHAELDVAFAEGDLQALVAFLESLTGSFQGRPLAEAPTAAREFAAPATTAQVAADGGLEAGTATGDGGLDEEADDEGDDDEGGEIEGEEDI